MDKESAKQQDPRPGANGGSGSDPARPNQPDDQPNGDLLPTLVVLQMPFGKYKGTLICDLPVSYLEWFHREGFPNGKLGMLLATMYEIKINGLDKLLDPLKKK